MSEASDIIESSGLKTYKRPVNFDEVVLKALFERMDPATRTVTPQWRSLAESLGVCTVTLGRYIHQLKEDGLIATVEESRDDSREGRNTAVDSRDDSREGRNLLRPLNSTDGHPSPTWLPNSRKRYFINESVDADWAASVVPQFERVHVSRQKRRYKTTKAEMDALADARMAERCRLIMEDFVRRMDPLTHTVAPKTKDIAQRIGRKLSTAEYTRAVRTFKAAGLVEPRRIHDASGDHSSDYVFVLNTEAIAELDYLKLAQTYRLKTVRLDSDGRRNSSSRNELGERILVYMRERMSSETHLVKVSQVEMGKAFGYFQGTISAAIRLLIDEKRLAKVVGKARRGMGNDATVYRVISPAGESQSIATAAPAVATGGSQFIATEAPAAPAAPAVATGGSQFIATAAPASPASPAPEIFTSLSIENFKTSGKREICFDRFSVVNGKSGADSSQVFDALRILHGIAQGSDASAFQAFWFGTDWPTTLSITLNTLRHGRLTYSVTLQRIDDNRVRVADERLAGRFDTFLVRRKHFYTIVATKERRGIGTASFALYDAGKSLEPDDPVETVKRCLGDLWLLNPDPNAMKSEIGFGVVKAETGDFADFVTCMVVQQKQPAVANAMRDAALRLCPGLVGWTVEQNSKGIPCLAVRHRSDLDAKGTPFALIDSAEKILFLVAFVCAMNNHSAPMPVVWLSPFNWLSASGRNAADRLLRTTFASRGQMILLA